ncbi:HNH endonuclease [Streptomyces olivaceus]|nr:HNH endonuclease [Streptomyces olivaceus]
MKLTVDHVVPQALGGGDEPANLVTACEPCNSGKTSVPADAPIAASVEQDAMRWAAAMGKAAEMAHAKHEVRLDYRSAFRDAWDEWKIGSGDSQAVVPVDPNWETSLDNFYEAGLPDWELREAVRAAMTNQKVTPANTFRYFAGICWTKIRQIQDHATQIVSTEAKTITATVSDEDLTAIAKRWQTSYQQRCDEVGIERKVEDVEHQVQVLRWATSGLLEQGYSVGRLADAAEEAGRRLTLAIQEYLGGWGDLVFDATFAWIDAWQAVSPDHPAYNHSSVPNPADWRQIKEEIREAVRSGVPDVAIVAACQGAGELRLAVLTDVPGWDR